MPVLLHVVGVKSRSTRGAATRSVFLSVFHCETTETTVHDSRKRGRRSAFSPHGKKSAAIQLHDAFINTKSCSPFLNSLVPYHLQRNEAKTICPHFYARPTDAAQLGNAIILRVVSSPDPSFSIFLFLCHGALRVCVFSSLILSPLIIGGVRQGVRAIPRSTHKMKPVKNGLLFYMQIMYHIYVYRRVHTKRMRVGIMCVKGGLYTTRHPPPSLFSLLFALSLHFLSGNMKIPRPSSSFSAAAAAASQSIFIRLLKYVHRHR